MTGEECSLLTKWEYNVFRGAGPWDPVIHALGLEGWELAAIQQADQGLNWYYLKRPVQEGTK